jgi:CheY-like chemotaxis protein/REP element-mobilizing transposase RayT
MATPVLVVDANREFGILIRQSLEETGRYEVRLTTSGAQALELAEVHPFELAIIDFDLPDLSGGEVVRLLRSKLPQLSVIAIPLSGHTAELADLQLQSVIPKPFYLPELPAVIEQALSEQDAWQKSLMDAEAAHGETARAHRTGTTEPKLPLISPQLDRLLEHRDGSPLAAVILKEMSLLTGAGLPARQLEDVAGSLLERGMLSPGRGAVAQYVRPVGSSEDHLVYATNLRWDATLAVLFPSGTAFSTVRRVTEELGRALMDPGVLTRSIAPSPQPEIGGKEPPLELPKDWVPSETPSPSQRALLEEITRFELAPLELAPEPPMAYTERRAPSVKLPNDWIPKGSPPEAFLAIVESEPSPSEVPRQVSILDALRQEAAYYLPFTAVLVPRIPEHRLEGEFARKLVGWVDSFCVAWDWRADEIDVQPQYLAITVSLIPESAPAHAVEQLRDDLSRRIFERHPDLLRNLPSGRFWARAYLLSAGRPPDRGEIRRFLDYTRRAQGLGD